MNPTPRDDRLAELLIAAASRDAHGHRRAYRRRDRGRPSQRPIGPTRPPFAREAKKASPWGGIRIGNLSPPPPGCRNRPEIALRM